MKQLKKIKARSRPVLLSGGTLRTRSFHVLYITMAVQTKKQSLQRLNTENVVALLVVKVRTPEWLIVPSCSKVQPAKTVAFISTDFVFVIGGARLSSVIRLDVRNGATQTVAAMKGIRVWAAAAASAGEVVVAGGGTTMTDGSELSTVEIYSVAENTSVLMLCHLIINYGDACRFISKFV